MKVAALNLNNFMSFDDAIVELPREGIVLLTGGNGEGKSSIVEAVPAACWNKTLRKAPWWRDGEVSEVGIRFFNPELSFTRRRTKGGSSSVKIDDAPDYDNSSKAQVYIDDKIPDLDIWRKTSVFTSAAIEGKNFSGLGDGGQKRLIETLLGLDRFDPALTRCREDLTKESKSASRADNAYNLSQLEYQNEERRRDEAAEDRDSLKMPERPEEQRIKLGQDMEINKTERRDTNAMKTQRERAGIQQQSDLKHLRKKLDDLSNGNCPTCGQLIPDQLVDELNDNVVSAETELKKIRVEAEAEVELLAEQLEELQEESEWLRNQFAAANAAEQRYVDIKRRKEKADKVIAESSMALARIASEKAQLKKQTVTAAQAIKTLECVEHVLGLKGVRAQVIGQSFGGLAAIANRWLGHMGGIQIELASQRQKKDKTVAYENEMKVLGAGGGFGYNACSVGQRRRIDVSLLLGLAKLSSTAYAMEESTMFFDEVFDILDPSGVQGVAVALSELAASRCVVVISHAPGVQQLLEPSVHLHIEGGRVLEG
jgi:DNA repair exonuclease SbcCD ATPase subunit